MRPLSTTVVSRQPSASARSASVCCQLIGAAVEPSDADDGIGEKIDRRGSHAAFAGDPCDDVPGNLVDAHFNASARTEEEASARMFVRGTAFERSAQQVEKFVVHVCLMVMVRCGIVRTTVLPSSTIVRLVRSRTGLPRATSIASTTVSLGFLAGLVDVEPSCARSIGRRGRQAKRFALTPEMSQVIRDTVHGIRELSDRLALEERVTVQRLLGSLQLVLKRSE